MQEEHPKTTYKEAQLINTLSEGKSDIEKTKQRKKSKRKSDKVNDLLEKTPKTKQRLSEVNLELRPNSPYVCSLFGKFETKHDSSPFNPNVLQIPITDSLMISPSKLLHLGTPMPKPYFAERFPSITVKINFKNER